MSALVEAGTDSRVLLLAPTAKDADVSRQLLERAEIGITLCRSIAEICREIPRGAGVVVVPEEAVLQDGVSALLDTLRRQPRWSNLPVLVLTAARRRPGKRIRTLLEIGDVTLLKRPLERDEFLSAIKAALRDRARQYLVREQIAALADQAEALREADQRKDEFLAMLAHELRNPLAPLRNGLLILHLASEDTREVMRTREMMDRQLEQLTRLVDDLLDVSRITRGKVELRKEPVDLNDVLTRAAEMARPLLEARGHDLAVQRPGQPVVVLADLARMTQVVGNLLNNAAKYSERGSRIHVALEQDDGEAVLRVRDSGVGIPPEMLSKVFELFTQVDRTLDRSQGGLGIGLTLVRSLVTMHGGTIRASSEGVGKGSEFVVRLPLLSTAPEPASRLSPEPTQARVPLRVLVVDDHEDARESLALVLRRQGHEVRVAATGSEALEVADRFRPEAALLDIGLPGMSGYDLARRLREQGYGASMVLVALTGYGQEGDRRMTREAGFDHHLTKPADLGYLYELLDRAAASGRNGTTTG